jgi:hypothetical protein
MSPLIGSNGHVGVGHVSLPEARLGAGGGTSRPAPGRVSSGIRRQGRGRDAAKAVKAASPTLPRGPAMRPGHMIMDWLSREPHQVGHRRRVAVLGEGRVRDGVRDRVILLARVRSSGPRGTVQRLHFRRGNAGPIAAMARSTPVAAGRGGAGLDYWSARWLSEGVGVICLRVCVGLQGPVGVTCAPGEWLSRPGAGTGEL